jgi:transposase InsO family protein
VSRFQFVADHRDTFEVKRLCTTVEVGRSAFYAWLAGAAARAQRAAADEVLARRIRRVQQLDRTYGAPRVTAELNDPTSPVNTSPVEAQAVQAQAVEGVGEGPLLQVVNHKRVARVMREHHLVGLRLRRKVRTTIADPDTSPVPDLLNRNFTASAPNRRYVGDITYLPYDGGHLYLATVIDCYSRRLVGWSIAHHMRTDLVADALRAAHHQRGSLAAAIFHSDHGAQYGAKDYATLCRNLGVTRSMGAVGTSADNALAESFNAALKRETLQGAARWPTAAHARLEVFAWITRYNTRRRHSYCGHVSPNTYENTTTPVTLRPAA